MATISWNNQSRCPRKVDLESKFTAHSFGNLSHCLQMTEFFCGRMKERPPLGLSDCPWRSMYVTIQGHCQHHRNTRTMTDDDGHLDTHSFVCKWMLYSLSSGAVKLLLSHSERLKVKHEERGIKRKRWTNDSKIDRIVFNVALCQFSSSIRQDAWISV